MENYGAAHLAMLALFVVGIPVVIRLGRRHRGTPTALRFSRGWALVVGVVMVANLTRDLTVDFDVDVSLPLHLSDLSYLAVVVALWTQQRAFVAFVYYVGLVLTTQAIVTPSLGEPFPEPRFIAFWVLHLSVVWAALYLTVGLGLGPRWREYRTTVGVTVVWLVTMLVLNPLIDTNYGYVTEKPSGGSVADYFGPWPLYVLVEVVVVAGLWALLTLPWVREPRRDRVGAEPA